MTIKKHWKQINKGATACIIAPSYDEARVSLEEAATIVESYNLEALIYSNLMSSGNHTLFDNPHIRFANSDEVRASQLIDALNNDNCDLVWTFRGGYGAIRLLSYLNKESEPKIVKPFVGFSDITILHSYINNIWNWPSIHFGMPGAMPQIMQRDDTKRSFQNLIFGTKKEAIFILKSLNAEPLDYSIITGTTTGGNVLCFEKILGTKYSPNLNNSIIVFEDVGEPPRKIDGFLQKLQMMPNAEEIKAVIFATFTPADNQDLFEKIFKDFAISSNIPSFQFDSSNTIGHRNINNAFPLGTEANIIPHREDFKLTVLSGMEPNIHTEL